MDFYLGRVIKLKIKVKIRQFLIWMKSIKFLKTGNHLNCQSAESSLRRFKKLFSVKRVGKIKALSSPL